jgi:AAA+ superfamily predicted ATPase
MGLENLLSDALCQSSDYIAYYVSRKLAEMHPDKAIIDGDDEAFDLEAYVRAEQCAVVQESSVFNHVKTKWHGEDRSLQTEVENAWLNAWWQDQLIDIIFLTWTNEGYKTRHYWIVAEDREVAQGFFRAVCERCAQVGNEVLVFDDGYWRKNRALFLQIQASTFDELVLPEPLKHEIRNDFMQFFASREVYEKYKIPWKRGILLIGPPGNGKTQTVRALINQVQQPCLYVKNLKSRCTLDQDGIREVFAKARTITPCILVFEDIDSLVNGKNRSFFLNELDGFSANTGIVVVATTNHPERLDPAISDRPSRFDRKYYFQLPALGERLEYVRAWNEKLGDDLHISEGAIEEVARQTEGFSFAYMKELFVSSMMQWMALPQPGAMDTNVLERAVRLREQMSSAVEKSKSGEEDDENDEG